MALHVFQFPFVQARWVPEDERFSAETGRAGYVVLSYAGVDIGAVASYEPLGDQTVNDRVASELASLWRLDPYRLTQAQQMEKERTND